MQVYRTYKITTNKQTNQVTENVDHVAGLER
jgi:tRNA A37 N6-isopentenylltransferase MiaA